MGVASKELHPLGMVVALLGALSALGCARGGAPAPAGDAGAECAVVRDLGKRSLARWTKVNEASPAPDAPIAEAATHTETVARTAREIGADFTKAAPTRRDLADTAEGVRMLGDLAGEKLAALAKAARELDTRLAPLTKLENAANDEVDKLGRDIGAGVGCAAANAPGCAEVIARAAELGSQRAPGGLGEASLAAKGRADTLDALARAVDALPAAPPKQSAREETARHARAGAEAFRALAKALGEAAPVQDRIGDERQAATEAVLRLTAELTAAGEVCKGR